MKIGLLTYNNSANYGAVLQCYATCRILKELGHKVEIINVEQDKYSKMHDLVFFFKDRAFDKFQSKFYAPKTKLYNTVDELRNEKFDYDCIIVGSDQVWNPSISGHLCMAFFLDFDENVKKISYASSFGIESWPKKYESITAAIKKSFSKFDSVSVREKTGKKILKEVFGVDAKLVVDPTLLHENYREVVGEVKENGKIFGYLLNRRPKQLVKAKEFASYLGQKPRMISTIYPYKGFKYVYPPSLEAWIRDIGGARFVITDSFHGVVFSLIYRRNFIVITPDNGLNSRIKDLLALVGINNRFYKETDTIPYDEIVNDKIDYDKVHKILAELREQSIHFLVNALK